MHFPQLLFSTAVIFFPCRILHQENVADEKAYVPFKINMRQKKALNGSHLEVFLAPQCSTEHDFHLSISNLFLNFVSLLQEIKKNKKRGYAFKFQICLKALLEKIFFENNKLMKVDVWFPSNTYTVVDSVNISVMTWKNSRVPNFLFPLTKYINNLVKHHIKLTDPIPFKEAYRRIPQQMYDEVKAHIQEMLDLGAIRPSNSPWASAIVLVRKKDGRLSFCIDLRRLNNRTVKDAYSLSKIESILDSLLGAKIFSTLDLKAGYWQVEMAEECKAYTAFTCGPLGFYECDTMPFGATNAPATFQRLMHDCLGDLNIRWCIVYLDDIIIFSDTKEEHLKRLEAVFQKLAAAGLKLKPSKCFLFREEIEYLGHVVSGKGISTKPKKVEAVTKWPTPKAVYDVRSFLGFVGYYRRFIKNFSKISKPIREVITGLENQSKRTAKKTLIEWTEAANSAFETLKELCTSTPILAYPDYQLPFILHTDSSSEGLGAVLYQKQEGKLRVIAYASRSVSKTEANYPAHKLEFLALKWAVCEKFHEYLYGAKTFDIYTDNNPLTYVLTSAKLDACGQRWVAKLANYNFTIRYKCGQSNVEADALSRISWPEVLSDEDSDVDLECMDTHVVNAVLTGTKTKSSLIESISCSSQIIPDELNVEDNSTTALDWVKLQRNDPNLSVIIKLIESDQLFKRKLHRKDSPEVKALLRIRKSLKLSKDILYRKSYTDNSSSRKVL